MSQRNSKRCNPLVILSGLALMCGCSTFDRRWKAAASQPTPAGIEGRWQGSWTSDADKHTGGLRCLITHKAGNTYRASYAATYWKIFHFGYDMDLTVEPGEGATRFKGESDLGWPVGVYHYDGQATNTDFYCTYQSKSDHGHFSMTRPPNAP